MLLVTVLLAAASCSAAKIPSNERTSFVASTRRNDFIPITISSLHDFDGDSKRLSRKHLTSQQESSKISNGNIASSDNQLLLELYDPPSNYRRRTRNHASRKRAKPKSKRYITSDEIRSKRNQQPSASKDISNVFVPSPVDTQVSQKYFPPSDKYNINEYAPDKSIYTSKQEKLRNDRISPDFSHSEVDHLPSIFLQHHNQYDQSFNSYSNPTPEMSFSQNVYLPLAEVKQAPSQYVPPGDANEYLLPLSQIDAASNQYLQNNPQSNERDYSIYNPTNAVDSTPSIQITDTNIKVSNNDMVAEGQNQFPFLPPTETQHLSKDFLPASYKYEDKDSLKNSNTRDITENLNQHRNSEPSPISYSPPSEMVTAPIEYTPREDQPTYLSSQPMSQDYLPLQDFSDQPAVELNVKSEADRRNDFSYSQKFPAVQISNPVSPPHSFSHPQSSNFTTLRPIKQYNEIPPFFQTSYQNNPSDSIERSSHDNSLKTEAIMTSFPSQGQGFDPAKYAANQYAQPAQSMPFGSKLPQPNSLYASPRSSNLPVPNLQSNSEKQYETTAGNLNSKYEPANSLNNLRQPLDLIVPNPYEPYQQQNQHSYAKNYAHQSYPAESSTEAVPILKQTNEIAYDGSFHYETLTGDQTHVIQEGHIENPGTDDEEQVIHGSYSFVGGDGITYTVNYVADSNGFRAAGDHLPTPPPVPDVIQRSIEVNLAAEANKAAQEYQSQSQPDKKGADRVNKGSLGYLNDQTSRNFDLESKRPIQNFRNPFSENFNNYRSYENPPSVNRNQYHVGNNNNQNNGYQNSQIDRSNVNQGYQSSQNDKKTYIPSVNPNQSYQNTPTNNNAQGYPSVQTSTNNIAQGYPNVQNSNNNIHGHKNIQTSYNHNLPNRDQNGQTGNKNIEQDLKNSESSYINDNQSFQNYQTSNDNSVQNYKNPRIDDSDRSLGYQNSLTENNNNQGYQNPQTIYNNNIQGYQAQQNSYNNNIASYQGSQIVGDKNDPGYSNTEIVNNNQYQSFSSNPQPAEIVQNYPSSETMTESVLPPKVTGYL